MVKLRENALYIFKIDDIEHSEDIHTTNIKLSEKCVFIDKGRAIYYTGFTNQYVLIGFLRTLFTEPLRTEIMQTANKLGDVFVFNNQSLVAIWTGTWEPMERMGFIGVTLNPSMVGQMINEIYKSMEENGGKLVDRC